MKPKLLVFFILGALAGFASLQLTGSNTDEPLNGLVIRYEREPTNFLARLDDSGKPQVSGVYIYSNGEVVKESSNGGVTKGKIPVGEVKRLADSLAGLGVFEISYEDLNPRIDPSRPDFYWKVARMGMDMHKIEVTQEGRRSAIEVYDLRNRIKENPSLVAFKKLEQAIAEIEAVTHASLQNHR